MKIFYASSRPIISYLIFNYKNSIILESKIILLCQLVVDFDYEDTFLESALLPLVPSIGMNHSFLRIFSERMYGQELSYDFGNISFFKNIFEESTLMLAQMAGSNNARMVKVWHSLRLLHGPLIILLLCHCFIVSAQISITWHWISLCRILFLLITFCNKYKVLFAYVIFQLS